MTVGRCDINNDVMTLHVKAEFDEKDEQTENGLCPIE